MLKRKQTSERSSKIKQAKATASHTNESDLWKRVFSDAREAFAQKKFKESVALFTRAITLKPDHSTLLDCRAASYEKVDQLALALRDAKSIIEIAPTESRGYLRAGKVLSLQKKYDKAIQVYKRALEKVDPIDSRYHQIALMQAQVEKKANPAPIRDFMQVLPYDVSSIIFSMLSFDRRVQCTGVCKSWRNFALSWSGMWRDLDFGDRKVPLTTIKQYLGYAKGRHVRRFAVANANINTMKKILQLLISEDCQYIEVLDLLRCEIPLTLLLRMLRLIGKNVWSLRLDEAGVEMSRIVGELLPANKQLTHLSMIGLASGSLDELRQSNSENDTMNQPFHLTHLRVTINDSTNGLWFLERCKSLKCLDFYTANAHFNEFAELLAKSNFRHIEKLYYTLTESLQYKTRWSSFVAISSNTMAHSPGLDTFSIDNDLSFTSQLLEFMIHKYQKSLKHLIITNCRSLDNSLARLAISPGLPCIETLSINAYIALEEWDLHSIITSCPTIEDLSMACIMGVTDSVLSDLEGSTKKLRRLDISHCNNVTGVGLLKIVKAHQSSLEKLILNDCQKIGHDAVKWATDLLDRRVVECRYRSAK